jgi:hypothetical protein
MCRMEASFPLLRVVRAAEKLGSGFGLVGLQPTDNNHADIGRLDPFLTNRPRSPEKCSRGEHFAPAVRVPNRSERGVIAVTPVGRE